MAGHLRRLHLYWSNHVPCRQHTSRGTGRHITVGIGRGARWTAAGGKPLSTSSRAASQRGAGSFVATGRAPSPWRSGVQPCRGVAMDPRLQNGPRHNCHHSVMTNRVSAALHAKTCAKRPISHGPGKLWWNFGWRQDFKGGPLRPPLILVKCAISIGNDSRSQNGPGRNRTSEITIPPNEQLRSWPRFGTIAL